MVNVTDLSAQLDFSITQFWYVACIIEKVWYLLVHIILKVYSKNVGDYNMNTGFLCL